MKKFRFSLDVILKLREHKEEECRIKLGKISAESHRLKQEIHKRHNLLQTTGAASFPGDFQAVEFYRNRLAYEIEHHNDLLDKNEIERKKASDLYIQAMAQLKAYRKLRNKRYKEYKKETIRQELKTSDEMNISRHNRRSMIYGN